MRIYFLLWILWVEVFLDILFLDWTVLWVDFWLLPPLICFTVLLFLLFPPFILGIGILPGIVVAFLPKPSPEVVPFI